MPDEPTQKPTEQPNSAPPPAPAIDTAALGEAISKGVSAALKADREAARPAEEPIERLTTTAPVLPREPSDAEIEAAMAEGDNRKTLQLMHQRQEAREARLRQEFNTQLREPGAAAISQLAEQSVQGLKHYKRFEKEIKQQISLLQRNYPGALITPTHWKSAYDYVVGQHTDELVGEATEVAIRQAREPVAPAAPSPNRGGPAELELPTTLKDELGPGFEAIFKRKARDVGGRSEDEEVRKLGYRGGVADYLKERREMQQLVEDDPSCGLG